MELKPLDHSELIEQAAGWLALKEHFRWLDFGDENRSLSPALPKGMSRSDRHVVRDFKSESGEAIAVAAPSKIDRAFRTATVWATRGDKHYARSGYGTRAVAEMVRILLLRTGVVRYQLRCRTQTSVKIMLFDLLATESTRSQSHHE